MKHHDQVADAFGSTAAAYLTSQTHATGADLQTLAESVAATPGSKVLDMELAQATRVSAVAPHAQEEVVGIRHRVANAGNVVDGAATDRGLTNIRTQQGAAENVAVRSRS